MLFLRDYLSEPSDKHSYLGALIPPGVPEVEVLLNEHQLRMKFWQINVVVVIPMLDVTCKPPSNSTHPLSAGIISS